MLIMFCVLASASYLAIEIYAGFRSGQSQASLARFRTWIETHTDQVIISGSLIPGFCDMIRLQIRNEPGLKPGAGWRQL